MTTGFRLLLSLFVVLGVVCPAAAQTEQPTPARPYRGLFGGAQPLSAHAQSLDLSLSGFGGWDQPLPPEPGTSDADRVNVSGPYSGATAGLQYNHPGDKLRFSAFGSGFAGYFPDNQEEPWYTSSAGGATLNYSLDLGPRNRLGFATDILFATDAQLGLVGAPGSGPPLGGGNTGGFESSLQRDPNVNSNSGINYTHDFSRVSSLTASYGFRYSHFLSSDTERADLKSEFAGLRYHHYVGKGLGVHLGYEFSRNWASNPDGTTDPSTFQNIDAGVDYSKALSISRKTTLAFHTGSTIASGITDEGNSQSHFSDPHFYFVGGAALNREIGRSWTATATYDRSVSYVVGFNEPALLDSATAVIGGLIGRRTSVSSGIYYTSGAVGLATRNYHSWYASSQLQVAIYRSLAAYASYYYYLYNFGSDVTLPTGVVSDLQRSGARVGLTAWLPLWYSRGVK